MQNAPSGIGSVRRVRRAGGGLALLSPDRIVLLDMARRGGQRECALPESLAADGAELVDFAFDAQVPQLLYAATSTGLTIVFNTKLRRQVAKEAAAAPPEGGGVGHARRGAASPPECRWLDTVGAARPATHARAPGCAGTLGSLRGYVLALGGADGSLRLDALNVSSLYYSREAPSPAETVHSEVVDAAGFGAPKNVAAAECWLSAAGAAVWVGAPAGTLHLYSSSLPYEPPSADIWPRVGLALGAIALTVGWQLWRKSKPKKGGRNGRGRFGRAGGDDDDDDDDRASLPDRYRRGGRPPGNGRPQPRGMGGPQHGAHAAMYGRALSDDIDSD